MIGFQADAKVDASSNDEECDKVASGKLIRFKKHRDRVSARSLDSLTAPPVNQDKPLTGYDLVKDMMRRQDAVLTQLDDLNDQIESTIKEISAVRKSEIEALETKPESNQSDSANPAGQRKAA